MRYNVSTRRGIGIGRQRVVVDIAYLVARSARERPTEVAVVCDGHARTFRELDARAIRLANGLRELGAGPGDRIAVLLENCIEYPEIDVSLAYGNFIRVALNARLSVQEFSVVLEDSAARVLITDSRFDATAAELVAKHGLKWLRLGQGTEPGGTPYEDLIDRSSARRPDTLTDPGRAAWIQYTSGTTGRPKGVILSHRALVQVAFNIAVELGPITAGRSILLPQPLSHGAGFFVLPYLAGGGTVHLMRRFDPEEALARGARDNIATLKLVPTMLVDLLDTDGPSPFETIIYGAAPISSPQLESALDRFGPVLIQIYGQSEAPVTISVLHKIDHARPGPHRASAGRPWRTVKVEVVDDAGTPVPPGELGEVVVAGQHLMDGYHGRPDLTREVLKDGRVWTRDMAVVDEQGHLYLRGRRDEMINSGGFNISPKEIEDVVVTHAAVDECAAIGVPHPRFGQTVRVYITLVPGARVTQEQVEEFCGPALGFRRPREVVVLEKMPRTPYGKVDRTRLRGADHRIAHGSPP